MNGLTLLPSATEIVCWIGKKESLLGVSHECDFPESVSQLPKLTASRLDHSKSSSEIHDSISRLLESSIGIYKLNIDEFIKLKPDFVITQDLCNVCAVSFNQVEDACRSLTGKDVQIISLHPKKWGDIWDDIQRVAKLLEAEEACAPLIEEVKTRTELIKRRVKEKGGLPKKILTIEWFDPVMISGLWVPEMIEYAGGIALFAASGEKSQTVSFDQLSEVNPDTVLIKPCGYKLDQTLNELDALHSIAPWSKWNAAKNDEVYMVDGNSYFNRPGPRLIDSLEILSVCARPGLFPELETQYRNIILKAGKDFPSLKG